MPQRGMFGGSISAYKPTLTETVHDKAAAALQGLLGQRMAHKVAGLIDYSPVGAVTQGFDAGQQLRQGQYLLGGLNALLAAAPIPAPAKKFIGKAKSVVEHNDNNGLPNAMNSLASFLRDPRPLHEMYDVGDLLIHNGEVGEVVGATGSGLVLKTPNGQRIVPRRDPGLQVAPPHMWRK